MVKGDKKINLNCKMQNEINNTLKYLFHFNGIQEILQFLSNKETKTFNKIKQIKNQKTDKVFSANTIALRLLYLEEKQLIKRKMFKNGKRWHIGYIITDKGLRLLKFYNNIGIEFKKLIDNN
ncbi:MAG: hypothetical protein AB1571_02905 [Nanoarchaeota archaeon]